MINKDINYPLAQSTWDDKEIQAIQRVIDSDNFTMGPCVKEYEKQFANYFGSNFSIMTSSGSTANLLMIAALFFTKDPSLKLEKGDEVIVPAVSWSTTYFPLQQYGLKLRFVDIDKDTLNFDLDSLKNSLTKKTKAIVAVNLLGNPNNFTEINKIIEGKEITLIEDNCESMGAKFEDSYCGSFGEMGTFSSFFSHHISTMEGGCVITDNEELYHIMLSLRAHGWTRNLPDNNKVTGKKSEDLFEESFKFILPGYNLRPIEMSGSIGIEQLKKLPTLITKRRDNAKYFQEYFTDHPVVDIQKEVGTSSWFGFALILKEGINLERNKMVLELGKIGVECRPIVTGNFAKHEVMKFIDAEIPFELKNADLIDKNGFFIGNNHIDVKDQLKLISESIKNIANE